MLRHIQKYEKTFLSGHVVSLLHVGTFPTDLVLPVQIAFGSQSKMKKLKNNSSILNLFRTVKVEKNSFILMKNENEKSSQMNEPSRIGLTFKKITTFDV